MKENAKKLYNLLLDKYKEYPMRTTEHSGFMMSRTTHSFDGCPACIKGFTIALLQGKKGNEAIERSFNSINDSDEACARFIQVETKAAVRLFYPYSNPLKTSVLDIIWSHVDGDVYNLKGVEGAGLAAEALKKCCENFPRIKE